MAGDSGIPLVRKHIISVLATDTVKPNAADPRSEANTGLERELGASSVGVYNILSITGIAYTIPEEVLLSRLSNELIRIYRVVLY